MVNDSRSHITQVEWNKRQYTARNVKMSDCARRFQHITVQPVKQILHAFDDNILQNLLILWEDVRMAEDIYVPSVPHFQGKIVRHKVHHL